jgi:TP901 family phage tail tape measure protein
VADLSTTIAVIFDAIDRATPTVDGVERALGRLQTGADKTTKAFGDIAGNVQQATQPLADLAVGVVKVEGAFIGAGVALTAFAVKTAGDFDVAIRQISTLFDASDKDIAKFRDSVLEYSRTSSKSLDDITQSLAAAIGSGVEYSKSIELIATAEKLAVATKADLKGTTDVLVSTLNAYGMKTEDAGKVADIFFQTIKDGKIEMTDLAQSLAMVTPLAAAAGVDLKEVGAAVAALTASGVAPSTAIEYLRSAISNIIKPSKDAAALAEELGIQFDAQALKSKGLAGVLTDVAKATNGNVGPISRLIGDVGGLVAALNLTGPASGTFKSALEGMANATGAVDTAFAKMSGSVEVATAKMNNAFKALLVDIGGPLLEEAGGIANAIANIFNVIGASVREGALRDLVAYVESAMGDLVSTLEAVARNLPAALGRADLSGFIGGIDAVREAFRRLFGGIDLTSVDGLTKAIELAGAAFLGLSKFTAGVISSFGPLFDLLVRMGSEMGESSNRLLEIGGALSGAAIQANALAGGIVALLPSFELLINLILLKQGIGILGGLKGLVATLPTMAAGLTQVGIAITTYLAAEKVVQLVQALVAWKEATDKVSEANARSAQITERAGPSLEKFAQTSGIVAKSLDEANRLIDNGTVVWSDAVNGWVKAEDALADVGKAAQQTVNPFEKSNAALLAAAGAADKAGKGAEQMGKMVLTTVPIIDAATGKIVGYEQQMVRTQDATGKAATATEKNKKALEEQAKEAKRAEEAQERLRLELEKLASNERIKLIEARVQLNVTEVQEQTKRIQAAFESLDNTVNSTAEVISKAFGVLGDQTSKPWIDNELRNKLFDQIDRENGFRERALKTQEELTQAQIDLLRQQARQIERGDALIKIDGTGLEPHIEAFMFEILKKLQVTTTRDGLKILLGMT